MKIITWNINSVRLRFAQVAKLLKAEDPDVLCLQEIKVINDLFPSDAFKKLGYVHQAVHGQKGYHGVATLSKAPFRTTESYSLCDNADCRHIAVTLEDGIELHNFYVPAGADIPDPAVNPKFAHKLDFLREMITSFERRKAKRDARLVLVGDLNVAPLENDVWSHKQLLNVVSHTPVETDLLKAAQAAFDWVDVTRHFVPDSEKVYSWWSYRARDWEISDRGRRLDHIWVSQGLKDAVQSQAILKRLRGWTQASDHVPVVANLAL